MKGIYIVWLREIKKYLRNKSRIFGSLGMPFFFLFIIGSGLKDSISLPIFSADLNYQTFIMPGIIAMVILFSSVISGVSIIWDKQFGFMKELLVAPIHRLKIVIGKTLGGATTSIFQGLIMLILSFVIGIRPVSIVGVLLALPVMFLLSSAFVSIGIAIASKMDDMHGFQIVMNFFIMPVFFLSGALFPLDSIPTWLSVLVKFNPMTYGVEALRYCFLGVSSINIVTCIIVLIGFNVLTSMISTYFFNRMEN
jgi:ABC-2 type transport system permease protein